VNQRLVEEGGEHVWASPGFFPPETRVSGGNRTRFARELHASHIGRREAIKLDIRDRAKAIGQKRNVNIREADAILMRAASGDAKLSRWPESDVNHPRRDSHANCTRVTSTTRFSRIGIRDAEFGGMWTRYTQVSHHLSLFSSESDANLGDGDTHNVDVNIRTETAHANLELKNTHNLNSQ
jgi:hypothetical protein